LEEEEAPMNGNEARTIGRSIVNRPKPRRTQLKSAGHMQEYKIMHSVLVQVICTAQARMTSSV
jgi:hypothetical protein